MPLWPNELQLVAGELDRELKKGSVQRLYAPTTDRVYLELRVPGKSVTVLACSEAQVARLSAVDERPANPPTPPAWQSVLRRELVGAVLEDVEAVPARRLALLHFRGKGGAPKTLALEAGGHTGIALTTAEGRILALSSPARPGLRVGATWTPPEEGLVKESTSRLQGDRVFLRLAHAAEAQFGHAEQRRSLDARRTPILARLRRLERTREKVRVEAERTAKAQVLRAEGELLKAHLGQLHRGATSITLDEYLLDGTCRPITISLDPRRTPLEEVDWRFKQYKRLTRGAEMARARLVVLDEEELTLRAELEAVAVGPATPLPVPKRVAESSAASRPYREYLGSGGQRVWVGRGAAHNDTLTFHVARPFHMWFHARGVRGAHVVVPLEKSSALAQEVMLDAAHLALFHSDSKTEPKGEVSYTQVKFVRRGDAPGAVTYTRERTINVRVEPERLKRLLASEAD